MDQDQLRRRVAEARVARVGTVDEQGRAHLVPIVFVVDGVVGAAARPRPGGRGRRRAGQRPAAAVEKYPQFGDAPPAETAGPVTAVDIEQWSGWAYSD